MPESLSVYVGTSQAKLIIRRSIPTVGNYCYLPDKSLKISSIV